MDTNTNFQTFNGNLPSGNFGYGQLVGLDQAMGLSAGNQPTFIQNGNIYRVADNGNNTFGIQQVDTVANRQQLAAQQAYQAATGSAISGLQTGKANLAQQYSDLLKTVTGEYQPLINQTTANAGAEEARRGLSPDSFLNQQQVQGALQPIYGAEEANAQQIGQGSISDTNTYNQAIANAQLGVAGTSANLPLQYGSLSLSQQLLPSQIALNTAQGSYYGGINPVALQTAALGANKPFGVGNIVFNPSNNSFSYPKGGGGDQNSAAKHALSILDVNRNRRPSLQEIRLYATE